MRQILVLALRTIVLLIAVSFTADLEAKTIHVDINAAAGGDGVYWATSFNDLQDALGVAIFGDIILMAEGEYIPTDDGDRSVSFLLVNGVNMMGGFTSTDTLLSQRDWENNITVLSGDLNSDGSSAATNGDNSYTVIYTTAVSAQLILDGLFIVGGNASNPCGTGSALTRTAGGWYNDGSQAGGFANPTIKNCKFINNFAGCSAGAMFNNGTDGGQATPNFTNVTFEGNYAYDIAGAIYNSGHNGESSPSFLNCKFMGNGTAINGYVDGAKYAGAMYNFGKNGNANVVIVNCIFSSNYSFAGGAVYNLANSGGNANPTIINCTFYNNQSQQNAGACYVNGGDTGDLGTATATVINTIYYQNSAGPFGGDIFRNHNGTINIQSSMVDKPVCDDIAEGGPVNCIGAMYYNGDPSFVDAGGGDFTPNIGSTVINLGLAGINGLTTDVEGNARIQQGSIDIGAVESPFAPLPIELLSFQARLENESTALIWTTASEYNNDYFEIQRSSNGIDFVPIGVVKGSTYSSENLNYQFKDDEPLAGTNYYRLRQVDYSREANYSNVRTVIHHDTYVEIFPNPTIDQLNINLRSTTRGEASFYIYNLLGKEMLSGKIKINESIQTVPITLSNQLEAGQYLLLLDFGSQQNQTFRFIKTRS